MVRQQISLESLAASLQVPEERLARLNDVSLDHEFRQGDWLVIPSQRTRDVKQLAAVDTSTLRRTPPLQTLPPPESQGVVGPGDTLVKLAQRYGLTLQELLRLNPGIETARLVAGTQIRLANSAPSPSRMVLGLKPTTSGGASWPELPNFGGASWPELPNFGGATRPSTRFNASLDELVRNGVVHPSERTRIRDSSDQKPLTGTYQGQACRSGALSPWECRTGYVPSWRGRVDPANDGIIHKPLSSSEQALLRRINEESNPVWRRYGSCIYNWSSWKLASTGSRTTSASCDEDSSYRVVAVSCKSLLINRLSVDSRWIGWRNPSQEKGEDQMMAALCANIK